MISAKEIFETKESPIYNQVGWIPSTVNSLTTTQPTNYKVIVKYMKRTPEAIGILRAIQTDIISDGYTFKTVKIDKRGSGKSKLDKVKQFCKNNGFKVELGSCIFDWLMLGNGALWVGDISKSGFFKEVAKKLSSIKHKEIKEEEVKLWADEANYDKKIMRSVAWSTMNIDLDKELRTIKGYRQIVAGKKANSFTPKEIIHAKFMHFDGKAYGFSPIEASINILSTLALIKDMHGNFFVNGGVPDWMFILPKEMAGSANVTFLEQNLQKYKKSSQKSGNLVMTGEVETVQMNKFDKDMEFQKLAIYYTGILALSFNMPMARVAAIIGAQVKANASATDLSEAGYWRSVSCAQDYWEDLLNTQFFEPNFGVQIKFNRGYKNDEIKEAQRDVQQFEVIDKLIERGAVRKEYAKVKLQIPDEYWLNKWEKPDPIEMGGGVGKPGQPGQPSKEGMKGTAGQAMVEKKKEEATNAADRKEVETKEFLPIDLNAFMGLFQDWVKTSTTRKVDYYIEGDNYNMFISLPDEKYKLVIGKSQLSEVALSDIMGFSRKIK